MHYNMMFHKTTLEVQNPRHYPHSTALSIFRQCGVFKRYECCTAIIEQETLDPESLKLSITRHCGKVIHRL